MIQTGLIGYPVSHSLSPVIHQHWLEKHGIAGAYKLFTTPPARLRQTLLRFAKKEGMGFNITVPHKEEALPFMETLDPAATAIGAVNTVQVKDGALHGYNTDAYGFITQLATGGLPDLSHAVILGAGGAARAAIVALQQAGAGRITLMNRTSETAQQLADEFGGHATAWDMAGAVLRDATLLVNTTSLGMKGQPALNLSLQSLPARACVYDIVYNPLETTLLKAAAARGCRTVDGLGMLLYQAQKAFAIWHGITPVVDDALRNKVLAHGG
jgi:shikimate dehydrogenase